MWQYILYFFGVYIPIVILHNVIGKFDPETKRWISKLVKQLAYLLPYVGVMFYIIYENIRDALQFVYNNLDYCLDEIKKFLIRCCQSIKQFFTSILTHLNNFLEWCFNTMLKPVIDLITEISTWLAIRLQNCITIIKECFVKFFSRLADIIGRFFNWLGEVFMRFFTNMWFRFFHFCIAIDQFFQKIYIPIHEFFTKMWNWLLDTMCKLCKSFIEMYTRLCNNLNAFINAICRKIVDIISSFANAIHKFVVKIISSFVDAIVNVFKYCYKTMKWLLTSIGKFIWNRFLRPYIWLPIKSVCVFFKNIVKNLFLYFYQMTKDMLLNIKQMLQAIKMRQWLKEHLKQTWQSVKNNLKDFKDNMKQTWQSVKNNLKAIRDNMKNFYRSLTIRQNIKEQYQQFRAWFRPKPVVPPVVKTP